MQTHGIVVHLRTEANVEYKKVTALVMISAFGILSVEWKIAQTRLIFHGILTAAMTLFQVTSELRKKIPIVVVIHYCVWYLF